MNTPSADRVRATLLQGIQIEIRNAKVYESLATLFDDEVHEIFQEMAGEERQHQADLEQRYQQRYGPVPDDPGETDAVIEAPDLADAETLIFDTMTLEQALEAGLEAETMARAFYRREAERAKDLELRKLYVELVEFEEDHVRRLDEKLARVRGHSDAPSR